MRKKKRQTLECHPLTLDRSKACSTANSRRATATIALRLPGRLRVSS
jgi:hypothetical protein